MVAIHFTFGFIYQRKSLWTIHSLYDTGGYYYQAIKKLLLVSILVIPFYALPLNKLIPIPLKQLSVSTWVAFWSFQKSIRKQSLSFLQGFSLLYSLGYASKGNSDSNIQQVSLQDYHLLGGLHHSFQQVLRICSKSLLFAKYGWAYRMHWAPFHSEVDLKNTVLSRWRLFTAKLTAKFSEHSNSNSVRIWHSGVFVFIWLKRSKGMSSLICSSSFINIAIFACWLGIDKDIQHLTLVILHMICNRQCCSLNSVNAFL